MLFEFFLWWYSRGWLKAMQTAKGWVVKVEMNFSAGVLLRTLFSPWKRIISSRGSGPGEMFRSMMDNLVSRCIGFLVRLITLVAACVLMVLAGLAGVAMVIAWPFVPLAIVYLIYRSFKG